MSQSLVKEAEPLWRLQYKEFTLEIRLYTMVGGAREVGSREKELKGYISALLRD